MIANLVLLAGLVVARPEPIETQLLQVHPVMLDPAVMERTQGKDRAVLLIHGLRLSPLAGGKLSQVYFHEWQKSGGVFVRALGKEADVFAFSYGQTVSLTEVSQHPALANAVKKLQFMGYKEIVLVGHSAGGLLARMLVEDHPDLPVTRVVQVSAPNTGSAWAKLGAAGPKEQDVFMQSLTKSERQRSLEQRVNKRIPDKVEFLCIVGLSGAVGELRGDGLVACQSQWSEDLQSQGIPAIRLAGSHYSMLRARNTAERVAELASRPQPRWTAEQVRDRRVSILGK
jgi:pimeloyl-ACP methyl ester carboxylesterase